MPPALEEFCPHPQLTRQQNSVSRTMTMAADPDPDPEREKYIEKKKKEREQSSSDIKESKKHGLGTIHEYDITKIRIRILLLSPHQLEIPKDKH